MKIKTRLAISFCIVISILTVEIILNQVISKNALHAYDRLKEEALPAIRILNRYQAINREAFLLLNTKVYKKEISHQEENRLLGILEVELPYLKSELATLRNGTNNPSGNVLAVNRVLSHTDSIVVYSQHVLNVLQTKSDYRDERKMNESQLIVDVKVANLHEELNTSIKQLEFHYNNLLEAYQQEFTQRLDALSSVILITGMIGLSLALLIAFQGVWSISRPISKLQKAAEKLESGDYGSTIEWKGSNELAKLVTSFNAMSVGLAQNFKLLNERKAEILEQEERFRKVIEASPAGLVLVNLEGEVILVNQQVEQLFQFSRQQVIGRSVTNLLPGIVLEEGAPFSYKELEKFIAMTVKQQSDILGLRKDGTQFPVELFVDVLTVKNERFVLLSIIDITDRRSNEQQIKLYVDQLEEKNKELQHFTYITSHDLQEPLLTLMSYSKLVKEQFGPDISNELSMYLGFMHDASQRMRALIKGLLDHSRIGTQKGVEIVDCNEILDVVRQDLKQTLKNSNALLEVGDLPQVLAYQLEMRMLFQNLIVNAAKFVESGTQPRIRVSHIPNDKNWVFCVEDEGIGIASENHKRIFNIFQTLNSHSKYDGVGVGLAHVKKIADAHNGHVWVESDGEHGSAFYFSFPKD